MNSFLEHSMYKHIEDGFLKDSHYYMVSLGKEKKVRPRVPRTSRNIYIFQHRGFMFHCSRVMTFDYLVNINSGNHFEMGLFSIWFYTEANISVKQASLQTSRKLHWIKTRLEVKLTENNKDGRQKCINTVLFELHPFGAILLTRLIYIYLYNMHIWK